MVTKLVSSNVLLRDAIEQTKNYVGISGIYNISLE